MRILKGLSGFVYSVIAAFTLLVYGLCYWTLTSHWLAGFMMMSLPLLILLHGILFLLFLMTGSRRWMTALAMLLLAYPFYPRLVKFGSEPEVTTGHEKSLKVISFNVLRFDEKKTFYQDSKDYQDAFMKWLTEQDADILCFQEFAPYKGNRKNFSVSWFENAGYSYYTGNEGNKYKLEGPAIISRYPLTNQQYLDFGALNGAVGADVIIGHDTVSVFSVHLHSMTLNLGSLLQEDTYAGRKKEGRITFNKMKEGWNERKKELKDLETWLNATRHPVILCGDFNETPFSYVYGKLGKTLHNAFEKKGKGFGFSFNQLPYFIRIDNQFFDGSRLEVLDFKTDNTVKFSDHYPLIGTYQLNR